MKFRDIISKNSYFAAVSILSVLLIGLSIYFGLDNLFCVFYNLNGESINPSIISLFGVFFAFLFAMMAILFSLREDSLFIKLIEKNNRNKKDLINYFVLSLVSFSIVILIALFLTVTHTPESLDGRVLSEISGIIPINGFLICSLFYILVFAVVNLICLLTVFILILRS